MKTFKKIMKWIGIVLGGLILVVIVVRIILDIVFGAELRQTLRELKAQGVPLTVAEITPPPVPDAENAALLIKQAVEMIPARTSPAPSALKNIEAIINTNSGSGKVSTDISGWTDAQREEGARLVQSDEVKEWYTLLEKAAQRPHYSNNPDWSQGPSMQLPNLGKYRALVRMLAVKAGFESQGGILDSALGTILTGLKLNNKLSEEPTLITQLVRVACDMTLIDELERLANASDVPAELTRALIAELSLRTDMAPWGKAMDGETVGMGMWVYDRLISGSTRELLSLLPHIRVDSSLSSRLMDLAVLALKPVLKKDCIVYLKLMSETKRCFELPYYQIADNLKQNPMEKRVPFYASISRLVAPNLEKVRERVAIYQAEVEVCRVGLALKLFKQKSGAYPDALDKLAPEFLPSVPVGPCTGKSLVYQKAGDGFLLYSLGPDQKDNAGKPKPRIPPPAGQTDEDFDIVWKCER